MKPTTLYFISACLSLVWPHGNLSAQASLENEVIAATGHSGAVAGLTISATVGEAVTTTIANNQSVLTQGFHQSQLTIVPVSDIVTDNPVSVFPNPATTTCTVAFGQTNNADIPYCLFDQQGRSVLQGNFKPGTNRYQLELATLAPGAYQLLISTRNANRRAAIFQLIITTP